MRICAWRAGSRRADAIIRVRDNDVEIAAAEGQGAVKDKNGEIIDLMRVKLANKLFKHAESIGDLS